MTVIATRFDGRGRKATAPTSERARPRAPRRRAIRRPAERRAGTAKSFESRPRDLELDVPEFVPGR